MTPAERAKRAWNRIQTYEVWAAKAEIEVIEAEVSAALAYERRVHSTLGGELVKMADELGRARGVISQLREALQRLLDANNAFDVIAAEEHSRRILRKTKGD